MTDVKTLDEVSSLKPREIFKEIMGLINLKATIEYNDEPGYISIAILDEKGGVWKIADERLHYECAEYEKTATCISKLSIKVLKAFGVCYPNLIGEVHGILKRHGILYPGGVEYWDMLTKDFDYGGQVLMMTEEGGVMLAESKSIKDIMTLPVTEVAIGDVADTIRYLLTRRRPYNQLSRSTLLHLDALLKEAVGYEDLKALTEEHLNDIRMRIPRRR